MISTAKRAAVAKLLVDGCSIPNAAIRTQVNKATVAAIRADLIHSGELQATPGDYFSCPHCHGTGHDSRVIDSRLTTGGIRRRRECFGCHKRFTTYETIVLTERGVLGRASAIVDMNKARDAAREALSSCEKALKVLRKELE